MSIVDRIRQIIKYKGISERRFCIEIGVSNGFLAKVKDVGSEKVKKILITYPEISAKWLITGEGKMIGEKDMLNESPAVYCGINEYKERIKELKQHILTQNKYIEMLEGSEKQSNKRKTV